MLSGLNVALPISFTQIWSRIRLSIAHFMPAAFSAAAKRLHRSLSVPSGFSIVNRRPSTW